MKKMNTLAKYGAGAVAAAALTFGATSAASAQEEVEPATNDVVEADEATSSREERRAARQERRSERRADISEIVGLSIEEIRAARDDGQSLADIAGDSTDELADYFVERATARVEAGVESGRLTEDEAAERLATIEQRIAERIENPELSERGERRGNRAG